MTEHSHLFLLNQEPLEISKQKIQEFYNLGGNIFSPNLEGVAQKMGLLPPLEVLDVFGGKSKSEAHRAFIFGAKRVPTKVHNR